MVQADEKLVPLADVQALALGGARPLAPVMVPIDEALGLVAAEDVRSAENVPGFANSAMDGFAVRAADTTRAPVELDIVGLIAAGTAPRTDVGQGQAVQIMTGAPVPPGTTGIAIVERTEPASPGPDGARRVRILDQVTANAHIRAAGSDITAGSVVLTAGTVLTPAHLGVLASVGAGSVLAHPVPRVGVMSTGDELVELAGDGSAPALTPGQIRDSNRHTVLALLRRDGLVPVDLGVIRDTEAAAEEAIVRALRTCDAVLTTGGVSMGEFDYVKSVLVRLANSAADTGGAVHTLGVAIRPAKPLVLAWLPSGERLVPIFGLPGNPVSSMVSYQVIALPALRVLAGHPPATPQTVSGIAAEDLLRQSDGKTHLLRVKASWRADGRLEARSGGGQMSHQLSALAASNALALIPDGEGVRAGDRIDLIILGPLPPS